jgi:hypothetical protein
MRSQDRFERETRSHFSGSKKLSRAEIVSSSDAREPVAFLGKLAALFGPPDPIDGGFSYVIRDVERDLTFTAYSGASGPSYGAGVDVDPERLRPSIRAFEELLSTVEAVDCSVEVTEEIEYGGETVRIGLRDGKPFRETATKSAKARRPKTYEDCVAIAKARAGAYPIEAGWQLCIDKALPLVPESFAIGERRYENCVGFSFSERDKRPVYLFDEGPGLEEIPVDAIPWATPLSPTAKLWLTSYAKWLEAARRGKKKTER